MRTRLIIGSAVMPVLVLVFATPALANVTASWIMVFPGAVSVEPIFGLLPTVLVAFIERPFVSLAGVDKRPLLRSIRANLLSLLAGIVIAPFILSTYSLPAFLALAAVAVTITILVEIAYFKSVLRRESKKLRWGWIVVGNIVSNLVLVGIAVSIVKLHGRYPRLEDELLRYHQPLLLMHAAISLTAVAVAIFGPLVRWLRSLTAQPDTATNDTAVTHQESEAAPIGSPQEMGRTVHDQRA